MFTSFLQSAICSIGWLYTPVMSEETTLWHCSRKSQSLFCLRKHRGCWSLDTALSNCPCLVPVGPCFVRTVRAVFAVLISLHFCLIMQDFAFNRKLHFQCSILSFHWLLWPRAAELICVWLFKKTFLLHLHWQQGVPRAPNAQKKKNQLNREKAATPDNSVWS